MICVEWKARPGYGDMTSPCSYINNLAEKTGENVLLLWCFQNEKGVKDIYEKEDSEEVEFRLQTIFDIMKTEDVQLKIKYGHNLPYKHSNLPYHKFHNYRLCDQKHRWKGGGGYVTFVTTENNKVQFKDYEQAHHKVWKDPTNNNWKPLYNQFDNVKFVDYDTPILEAIKTLQETELMISYDGSASSLARILGTPSYILSGRPEHTLSDFPNALISKKLDFLAKEMYDIQEICLEKIDESEEGLKDFLTNYTI